MKKVINVIIIFVMLIVPQLILVSQNSWEQMDVPVDAPIYDIFFASDGSIYAGGNGIFKSTDDGNSWFPAEKIIYNEMEILVSQTEAFVVAFGETSNGYLFASFGDGFILRSTNKGEFWEVIYTEIQNISSILVTENDRIFMRKFYDLYYSDDFGDTWTRFEGWEETHYGTFTRYDIELSPDNKLYLGYDSLYIIDPETMEYEKFGAGLDSARITCFEFVDEDIYIATYSKGIFHSTDRGHSWTKLSRSPMDMSDTSYVSINSILINGNKHIYVGTYEGIFYSTDEGATWSKTENHFLSNSIYNIKEYNNTWYVCTYGVYLSSDSGNDWNEIVTQPGYPRTLRYGMTQNSDLITVTFLGIYYSADDDWNFEPWTDYTINDLRDLKISVDGTIYIYSSYSLDETFFKKSTDFGKTWVNVNSIFDDKNVLSLKFDRLNNMYIKTEDDNFISISTDGGESFSETKDFNFLMDFYITHDNSIITYDLMNSEISTDFGATWSPLGTTSYNSFESTIYSFEKKGDTIWAGSRGEGVYISWDNGNNWSVSNNGIVPQFPGGNEFNIEINKLLLTDEKLWAATGFGLFVSTDYGLSWEICDDGIIPGITHDLILLSDEHLYVNTQIGVYKSLFTISGVEDDYSELSCEISPNPATDYIEIKIKDVETSLQPFSAYVEIFDAVGRIDTPPCPLFLDGGTLRLYVSHLQPGIYFVRVGGEFLKFVKM